MKEEKLRSLIDDLNRAEKLMSSVLNEIRTNISNPVEEIIKYGLEHSIISCTADVVYISKHVSDSISDLVIKMYDEYNNKKEAERRSLPPELMYAGVYSSLDELNAKFGTDFNSRCIPSGVIIKKWSW